MSDGLAGAPTAGLRLLNATDILAANDAVREAVPTPEWGEGTGVLVQSMTANQRFVWQQSLNTVVRTAKGIPQLEFNRDINSTVALVVCSVVGEDGEPVFSKAQIEALSQKNSAPIERIAAVARRLSHLRAEDAEDLSDGLKATNGASPSASA